MWGFSSLCQVKVEYFVDEDDYMRDFFLQGSYFLVIDFDFLPI